ncbi:response regulator [bacterium]|nr:response regulator [bacterium]
MKDAHLTASKFTDNIIVYVDDEQDNLTSFEMHLEMDFVIKTFADPIEALHYVQNEPRVAILIVDQVMPRLSGLELARQAKENNPLMICMMITGNATKQLAIEAVKDNTFWDFVEKPVDFGSFEMSQKLVRGLEKYVLEKTKLDYREGTFELLAMLIDDKDGHTHRHSKRVCEWAMKIGKKMDLSKTELMRLQEGAMVHDIGKISIPDDILKKPGRISALERKIIQTHPGRGGDILESIPQLRDLAPMARDHHERPDGKGYPRGLVEDEIDLLTSIVALADFFEALSAKRPYKEPWAIKDIVTEIAKNKGTQFKGSVVDALFDVLKEEKLIGEKALEEVIQSIAA